MIKSRVKKPMSILEKLQRRGRFSIGGVYGEKSG